MIETGILLLTDCTECSKRHQFTVKQIKFPKKPNKYTNFVMVEQRTKERVTVNYLFNKETNKLLNRKLKDLKAVKESSILYILIEHIGTQGSMVTIKVKSLREVKKFIDSLTPRFTN